MYIENILVKDQKYPINIQDQPDFSWNVKTQLKNWKQTAWQITVAKQSQGPEDPACLIWDSKKILSDRMAHIPYHGEALESDAEYLVTVQVWGLGTKTADPQEQTEEYARAQCTFRTALLNPGDWHGQWIGETEDHVYHIFRHAFHAPKAIAHASLFICGMGHYEFYINGKRLGDRVLEPGWTDYRKTCLYSCYDVTRELVTGTNGLGLILGDGMYNVPGGGYVYYPRSYGKCKFLLQMNIVYEDGSRDEVISSPQWHMAQSALTFSCIYGGEEFDARKKQPGFSEGTYVEGMDWRPSVVTEAPKGRLTAQNIPPLAVMKRYAPVSWTCLGPGRWLADFGTNFSGWIRARIKTAHPAAAHTITFIPGEILDKDLQPDQSDTGKGYHWTYTMDETLYQEYHPRFTYTGFRYVLMEGAVPAHKAALSKQGKCNEALPILEEIWGEFIYPKDLEQGTFWCDHPLFNQIHKIICQAMLSNTKSIFTDCPHREKLGWMEQTHLIGPSIMYNYNVHNLYEKILQDMADSQNENGLVPDICPQYIVFGYHEGFNDSPEWGSAVILDPWYMYKRYGDMEILRRMYPVMKGYMDYLTSKTYRHILHHGLGDWLDIGPMTPYSQNTPVPVIATNIYYFDLTVMKTVAGLLGKDQDAAAFAQLMEQVYDEFQKLFFDDQTCRYANGSQAAQAMSLVTGLAFKGRETDILNMLVKDIQRRGYQITAGDVGHPFVIAALMQYGQNHIIDQMTRITDKPGYGYQVACGATTLTEEWDGPDPQRPHGSQNHLMLGSVEEWFYGGLAGILDLRGQKAFDEIHFRPYFSPACHQVEAAVAHPYGMIRLKWERRDHQIFVVLTIPPNARGILTIDPDKEPISLGSGEWHFKTDSKD